MKSPQFAERQYEAAAYVELARGRASPFVPTQNIEAYLGIDAAADPAKAHAIWRILSVQIPRRVALSPALWPRLPRQFHDEIPGRFCSLFLQFKRPIYQDSKRARYYSRIGGPYFEVGITPHQQAALLRLENRIGGLAVVRYASPSFWSRKDFDVHDEQRRVLANSAFVAPKVVKSHRKWMYAGPAGKAVLNPEPEEVGPESWENVIGALGERASQQSLRKHVRALAASLGDAEEPQGYPGNVGWLRRIAQYGTFTVEDNRFLMDLSIIAQAAAEADATWIVLVSPEGVWRRIFEADSEWWPWERFLWRMNPWLW